MNKPTMENLTIQELQRLAGIGIEAAITELGRRVIDYDFSLENHKREVQLLEDEIESMSDEIGQLWEENVNLRYDVKRLKCELGLV